MVSSSSNEVKVKGELKWDVISLKSSNNDNPYYRGALKIIEVLQHPTNGTSVENVYGSLLLFFWEHDFTEEQLKVISSLMEGNILEFSGWLGGRKNDLVKVGSFKLDNGQILKGKEVDGDEKTCSHSCKLHCEN